MNSNTDTAYKCGATSFNGRPLRRVGGLKSLRKENLKDNYLISIH